MSVFERLERAKNMVPESTEEIIKAVDDTLKESAAAGTTPDGVKWPAPVEGGTPLKNAATHIRTIGRKSGDKIAVVAKITEKRYVLHHLGVANGAPRRQIRPDEKDPRVHAAIKAVIDKRFADDS